MSKHLGPTWWPSLSFLALPKNPSPKGPVLLRMKRNVIAYTWNSEELLRSAHVYYKDYVGGSWILWASFLISEDFLEAVLVALGSGSNVVNYIVFARPLSQILAKLRLFSR